MWDIVGVSWGYCDLCIGYFGIVVVFLGGWWVVVVVDLYVVVIFEYGIGVDEGLFELVGYVFFGVVFIEDFFYVYGL